MTRQIGILGYPLAHSISPVFQQAALDCLGLDIRYLAWETEPAVLKDKVEALRDADILGANVTVPHKERVLTMLDDLDPTARDIGGVNTIVNNNGSLKGYNTDAPGFMRSFREDGIFDPRGSRAVVLGAGGAGRAVAYALVEAGVTSLVIVNRTLERAEALAEQLRCRIKGVVIEARREAQAGIEYDLLVNCTSIGMKHSSMEGCLPAPVEFIRRRALIYDLVYNPPETPLLKAAKELGAKTVGGLKMLIYQGAISFELWTGRQAPLGIMIEAASKELS